MVNFPKKRSIIVKWMFKTNLKPYGFIDKHRARLVAKGFLQQEGLDYDEVFALVAIMETMRLIISIASWKNWKLWKLDVKSAFINGPLDEEVFVLQPLGFICKGEDQKVLRLKNDLYSLKQSPRAWNKRIDSFINRLGFQNCSVEHVYLSVMNEYWLFLMCLYVDDLVITGSNLDAIELIKRRMKWVWNDWFGCLILLSGIWVCILR